MVRLLYEDFLESEEGYRACEAYWIQLVEEIAESLGQAGEWVRWMPKTHFDRIPPDDGEANPIFDARSRRLDRAIQIIQYPMTDDKIEMGGWVETRPAGESELPSEEMVIHLSLSEESAELAKGLLEKWMTPETTSEEMQTLIDSLFGELDEP